MDCPELDALGAELHARLQRGAFRGLPMTLDDGQVMEAERIARIVLADIEDIREWDHTDAPHTAVERRLMAVESEAQQLLRLAMASATQPRTSSGTSIPGDMSLFG